MIQSLLDAGADPNSREPEESVRGLSAMKGYVEICRLLIKHGADPNPPSGANWLIRGIKLPPVTLAAACGKDAVVRVWMSEGATLAVDALDYALSGIMDIDPDDGHKELQSS